MKRRKSCRSLKQKHWGCKINNAKKVVENPHDGTKKAIKNNCENYPMLIIREASKT